MFSKEEGFKKKFGDKKKEMSPEESSGGVTFFLLVGSVGIALLFHLSSFLPNWWQEVTTPRVFESERGELSESSVDLEVTPTPWQKDLEESLRSLVKEKEGLYGVYLYQIDTSQSIGINHQEEFPAASLMKLPVVVSLYQEAERRRLDLATEYRLRQEDKLSGNGSIHLQPEGTVYTYRSLAKLAIEQSDNTAVNVIAKTLGENKIQTTINSLNLSRTNYSLRQTSPEDMGKLLLSLYQKETLTSANSREIIGYLSQTIFNDQIPAALPENVVIAHKIGLDEGILHDAAIVFTDQGDFVLVIMSKEALREQAQATLEEITRMVWEAI